MATGRDDDPQKRPWGYDGARRRAERLASDPEETERLLERAASKAERVKNVERVRGFWSDLTALFRLVRARIRGEYTELPWRAMTSALAAIIYFFSPIDVVPDFIPFLGYVYDAAVLAFVLRMIAGDIARFRDWEDARDEAVEVAAEVADAEQR
jgi:uncharacterized membrane protein YkvA (DUF1232 family)